MDPLVRNLLAVYASFRKLGWLLAAFPTWRTTVGALADGLPQYAVWLFGLAALALSLAVFLLIVMIADLLIVAIPEMRERATLARELDRLRWMGVRDMVIQEIVNRWTGDIPSGEETPKQREMWTYKLRQIKAAIALGWIEATNLTEDGSPQAVVTRCALRSVVSFLRSPLKWLKLESRDYLDIAEERVARRAARAR